MLKERKKRQEWGPPTTQTMENKGQRKVSHKDLTQAKKATSKRRNKKGK